MIWSIYFRAIHIQDVSFEIIVWMQIIHRTWLESAKFTAIMKVKPSTSGEASAMINAFREVLREFKCARRWVRHGSLRDGADCKLISITNNSLEFRFEMNISFLFTTMFCLIHIPWQVDGFLSRDQVLSIPIGQRIDHQFAGGVKVEPFAIFRQPASPTTDCRCCRWRLFDVDVHQVWIEALTHLAVVKGLELRHLSIDGQDQNQP